MTSSPSPLPTSRLGNLRGEKHPAGNGAHFLFRQPADNPRADHSNVFHATSLPSRRVAGPVSHIVNPVPSVFLQHVEFAHSKVPSVSQTEGNSLEFADAAKRPCTGEAHGHRNRA